MPQLTCLLGARARVRVRVRIRVRVRVRVGARVRIRVRIGHACSSPSFSPAISAHSKEMRLPVTVV